MRDTICTTLTGRSTAVGGMMTLAHPILGTLDLNANGLSVSAFDTGFAPPRDLVLPHARRSGSYDLTAFRGERVITLNLALNGRVRSPSASRDLVSAYLHPSRRSVLSWTEPGQETVIRTAEVVATSMGSPIAHHRQQTMDIQFRVPSGNILSGSMRQQTIPPWQPGIGRTYPLTYPRVYPTGSGIRARASNGGSAPADWTALMYGPLIDPILWKGDQPIALTENGGVTVGIGEFVKIDSRDRSILMDGDPTRSVAWHLDFQSSDWWLLDPGDNFIRLTATVIGNGANGFLQWWDTW